MAVQDAARDIVTAVGGQQNINAVTHCVTRLRFVLTDESKVDPAALEAVDEVKGSFSAGGQFQVVIGPGTVEKVYAALLEQTGGTAASKEEVKAVAAEAMPASQRFVKMFSDIFVPLLPALVTAGLLMGINNILTGDGIFFDDSSLVDHATWLGDIAAIINMIANTAFVFLPVLIGWSAVRRFGGNPLLGIVLGAMLVHPDLLNAWAFGSAELEGGVPTWEILGLHIQQVGYQGQVLPILVAAWVLVKVELWLKDRIAEGFQLLVVAPVALLVTGFFALLVIGPVTFRIGNVLADGLVWVFDLAPAIGGLLYGFLYAPLVITDGRSPMQWDATAQAGFTSGRPWIPVAADHDVINAENELADPHSVYWPYRTLARLRKTEPLVTTGVFELLAPEDDRVFSYLRRGRDASLLVVGNLTAQPVRFPVPASLAPALADATVVVTSVPDPLVTDGNDGLSLRPWDGLVLRLPTPEPTPEQPLEC